MIGDLSRIRESTAKAAPSSTLKSAPCKAAQTSVHTRCKCSMCSKILSDLGDLGAGDRGCAEKPIGAVSC